MSDKQTVVKGVRAPDKDWEEWTEAAKLAGKKSRNDWIVDLCNKAKKRILRKEK